MHFVTIQHINNIHCYITSIYIPHHVLANADNVI